VYSLTIDEKYCGVGIKMSWVELNPKELTIGRGYISLKEGRFFNFVIL